MKKRINIYMEEELHKAFKIYCINQGSNISRKVNELIKKEMEQIDEGTKE